MKGNSNGPNVLVIAVFYVSSGWTRIRLQALTMSVLEKMEQLKSWWEYSWIMMEWVAVGNGKGVKTL
jgi:hypothetical protein